MTTSNARAFSDIAIPPGVTLAEAVECRGILLPELAAMLDWSVEAISELIKGEQAITPDTAAVLAEKLGIPAQFWLNLEAHYRDTLAQQRSNSSGIKRVFSNLPTAPGRLLSEDLEFREITPQQLSAMLGLPPQSLDEIINGARPITPHIAAGLAEALGIPAQFWLNLEAKYRATLARVHQGT